MKPEVWRKANNLTLEDTARQLGLKSRGRLNTLERGHARWPTDLAIEMDRISGGAVPVRELRPDLHDVFVIRPAAEARP